jgi:RND family efflux transporter MFP subunit
MPPHRLQLWLSLALAGLSGCTPSAGARDEKRAPQERTVPVATVAVTRADLALPVVASGVLGADREAVLAFKVGGAVARVLVDQGARVQKGQLLAVLDATELKAAASQAADAVQKAERDVERARTLHAARSIALQDYQNAETGVSMARAQSEAAEFNLRHSALVAPAAGIIDRRLVQSGEIVAPGQPIFKMSTTQGGRVVRVGLVDKERLRVKLGDSAEVRFDAAPERSYAGSVSELATAATPGSGAFEVEIRVDDRSVLELPSGLTAKVKIAHTLPAALRLPLTALVDGRGRSAAIYTIAGERAARLPVEVLEFVADGVVLRDGPPDGTEVATLGAADLTDGARVRVVPAKE